VLSVREWECCVLHRAQWGAARLVLVLARRMKRQQQRSFVCGGEIERFGRIRRNAPFYTYDGAESRESLGVDTC